MAETRDMSEARQRQEAEAKLTELLGMTPDSFREAVDQEGFEAREFVKSHGRDAGTRGRLLLKRELEEQDRRIAAGESLLPYMSPGGCLWSGVTNFSRSQSCTALIENGAFALTQPSETLAEWPASKVRARRVLLWLGKGVRLDFPDGARWYFQPTGFRARYGRRATTIFLAALAEASRLAS